MTKELYEHKVWAEKRHKEIDEVNANQQKMIDQLFSAVFGDKNTDEKGMKKQIDEMYMVFISGGWTIRTIVKILAGLGVSAGGIIGIIKLYHLLFK